MHKYTRMHISCIYDPENPKHSWGSNVSRQKNFVTHWGGDTSTSPSCKILKSQLQLLPFIGNITHRLFGTATIKDVQILQQHIRAMEMQQHKLDRAFLTHVDGFSSYMSNTDTRIDNLMKGIKNNFDFSTQITRRMTISLQHYLEHGHLLLDF